MIRRKTPVAAAFGAVLALACHGGGEARGRRDPLTCEAAQEVLKNEVRAHAGKALVLSDVPYGGRDWTMKRLAGLGWSDPPWREVAQAFVGHKPSTPVKDCPGFADFARAQGVEVGPEAVAAAMRTWDPKQGGAHGTLVLSMGTPVMLQRDVLVEVGSVCGGLCASAVVVHIDLTGDGYWVELDRRPSMVF